MANLAELIITHRADLTARIAAYDAETEGARAQYKERIDAAMARYHRERDEAEADLRTSTEAARNHFEEALDRLGLTSVTIRTEQEGGPLDGMVLHPHLPEPIEKIPLPELVQQGKYRNNVAESEVEDGTREAEPAEDAGHTIALPYDHLANGTGGGSRTDSGTITGPALGSAGPAADHSPADQPCPGQPAGGTAGTAQSGLICSECGTAIGKTNRSGFCRSCWGKQVAAKGTAASAKARTAAVLAPQQAQAVQPAPEEKSLPVAPVPAPVIVVPMVTKRPSTEDLLDPSAPPPAAGDIPDYLVSIKAAERMDPAQRERLNAEIHAGLSTYRPRRFEIHQDIATGAYYCVPYREKAAEGSREILWMQYMGGHAYPTFFPKAVK